MQQPSSPFYIFDTNFINTIPKKKKLQNSPNSSNQSQKIREKKPRKWQNSIQRTKPRNGRSGVCLFKGGCGVFEEEKFTENGETVLSVCVSMREKAKVQENFCNIWGFFGP